jgi:hypothetical protein
VGGGDTITGFADLNPDGTFQLDNIPTGTYAVTVRGDAWLQTVKDNVTISTPSTDLGTFELKGADSNGDNTITFEDFSILQNNYGQSGASTDGPLLAMTSNGCGVPSIGLLPIIGLAVFSNWVRCRGFVCANRYRER